MYEAIRLVIFDSLTATLDRVAKKNIETADEEESEDDNFRENEVPARRQSCLITLAQLKDTLLKEWKDHALASAGELAGRAFQTVRDQHTSRRLREIFALSRDKDFDARTCTLDDLDTKMERAVKAGSAPQTSTTGPTGRGQASSTIAGIAAVCFASIGTLPETNRSTTLDDAKHAAYNAALVSFLHEFPSQEADIKAKFCLSLTTKACETNKEIRTVFFTSLTQALDAIAAANYEDDDEEESADGRYDGIPARRRPCRVSFALLKDGLQNEWEEIALAKQGEFAGRAFQTIRNHHHGRPLGEIFSTTEAMFDQTVMSHVMFAMVEWLLEVLDEDRKMFNTAAEESHESETYELPPALAKVHEAPGFNAMDRAADWVEKYRTPASGGGRPGTGGDGHGSRRKKARRSFLDTKR